MTKIALISDIHGNAVALEAALADIQAQACERIFFLGDVVNGIDPAGCIALLRAWGDIPGIKGNAEHYLLTPDLDTFPRREEPFYDETIKLLHWWLARMPSNDLAYIRAMPDVMRWEDWYMVHDSPFDRLRVKETDIGGLDDKYREFLFHGPGIREDVEAEGEMLDALLHFMDAEGMTNLFVGHTHVPFIKCVNGKMICNAGSVGMPLDGDYRPSWVLFDGQTFSIRRVEYDVDRAVAFGREAGYQDFAEATKREAYYKMLQTGWHWRVHI